MNVISITGELTHDPELRSTRDGVAACLLRIAVKATPGTAPIDVEAWGPDAHRCWDYLGKGCTIAVVGHLAQAEWIGHDGRPGRRVYVHATTVEFDDRLLANKRS